MPHTTRMTPRFDLVGMVTADMAATLGFYRRLGLDLPAEADSAPHAEAVGPGGVRLAWDTVEVMRSMHPGWEMPKDEGRVALAFRCEGPADVDRVYAEMTAAGYASRKEPWDAPWGQRYAVLADPDGTPVDLFAPLGD
ncbi:VOC family protein [Streptomyces sp. WMMC1477]|uniref:VOC family protein n=1 Tax=Streptomyces sp. WMMC1477 TaxID=3015155 RepID=UPI0022B73FA9|nr:VOC family protein [Streptomyces sp. WMMC1477]MCZ7431148.1 VOC family protein [Streptomyces sp. WMMC1477]